MVRGLRPRSAMATVSGLATGEAKAPKKGRAKTASRAKSMVNGIRRRYDLGVRVLKLEDQKTCEE